MNVNNNSRKRKRALSNRIKRFAKKKCSRSADFPEDFYKYYVRIFEMLQRGFQDEEEKAIFAQNALRDTVGQIEKMSYDGFLSQVLQKLIPIADDDNLIRFTKELDSISNLCTHHCASHVLQTLIKTCGSRFRDKGNQVFLNYVVKVSELVFNSMVMEEFRTCTQANQIARTCLCECAGYEEGALPKTPIVPDLITLLAEKLLDWSLLNKFIENDVGSAFMQCLLLCLSAIKSKILQKCIKAIVEDCILKGDNDSEDSNNKNKSHVFQDMAACRLLETAIQVADVERYSKIFNKIFLNSFKSLSCEKRAVFAVQKVITHCPEKEKLEAVMSELSSHFGQILKVGHISVLVALADSCKRLNFKEGEFLKALKAGVGTHSKSGLTLRLLFPAGQENEENKVVNKYGSMLIQSVCQFKKPISIVEDLLSIDASLLKDILSDPKGSFIGNAFVESPTIGEKSRERLTNKLKGFYREMALSKHGSRVLEAIWMRATLKEKLNIMAELDRTITTKLPGSIIATKFNLEGYLSDKSKWSSGQKQSKIVHK